MTFTTKSAAPPGAPTLGRTFNLAPVSGIVLIKVNGVFIPLTQLRQFPKNTVIDALGGTLRLITAVGGHPAADAAAKGKKGKGKKGKVKTQTGTFGGAIFKVAQAHNGLATLSLVENAFKGAPSFANCKAKRRETQAPRPSRARPSSSCMPAPRASSAPRASTPRRPSAAPSGRPPTAATERRIHDVTGSVAVTDFVRHKTIILHAGQSYLAKRNAR